MKRKGLKLGFLLQKIIDFRVCGATNKESKAMKSQPKAIIKVILSTIKDMERANFIGKMVKHIQANG